MVGMFICDALVNVQAALTGISGVIAGRTSASVCADIVGASGERITWVGFGALVNITTYLVASSQVFEASWTVA